jgi:hypothetical protein
MMYTLLFTALFIVIFSIKEHARLTVGPECSNKCPPHVYVRNEFFI